MAWRKIATLNLVKRSSGKGISGGVERGKAEEGVEKRGRKTGKRIKGRERQDKILHTEGFLATKIYTKTIHLLL